MKPNNVEKNPNKRRCDQVQATKPNQRKRFREEGGHGQTQLPKFIRFALTPTSLHHNHSDQSLKVSLNSYKNNNITPPMATFTPNKKLNT